MKAKELQGQELLARRFNGILTVQFEDTGTGTVLERSVKMDAVWDDQEEMFAYAMGLIEHLHGAIEARAAEWRKK